MISPVGFIANSPRLSISPSQHRQEVGRPLARGSALTIPRWRPLAGAGGGNFLFDILSDYRTRYYYFCFAPTELGLVVEFWVLQRFRPAGTYTQVT